MKKSVKIALLFVSIFLTSILINGCGQKNGYPDSLKDIEAYDIESLDESNWNLSYASKDDEIIEGNDYDEVLNEYKYTLKFYFLEDNKAEMIKGDKKYEGKYEIIKEGKAIKVSFEDNTFYGVMVLEDNRSVMILSDVNNPDVLLHCNQI